MTMIDIFTAMLIIGAVVLLALGAAVLLFLKQRADAKKRAATSLSAGSDSSDVGRMLQEKYRNKRDSGEFKHADL